MLCKTWKINSSDFTAYAHKNGLQVSYVPVKGLQDKYTMDGVRHVDLIKMRRIITIRTNPVTEAVAGLILAEYISGLLKLTIFDLATNANVTIDVEPMSTVGEPALVSNSGTITYYQIAPLVFEEL